MSGTIHPDGPNARSAAIPRRRMLSMVAFAGAAAAAWKLGIRPDAGGPTVTRRAPLMGTTVTITLVGGDPVEANAAADATLSRMSALEARLSRYRDDSDVGRLNATGALDDADDALLDLLRLGRELSARSDGAFDVTIAPLVDLYRRAVKETGRLPDAAAIEEVRSRVDYRAVRVEGRRVRLTHRGAAITLDGIGKGTIVDAGVATLRSLGYGNVLVEAGGDLVASGHATNDRAWTIGIAPPRPGMRVLRFETIGRAVATSGDYMQPFSADGAQHHILDPRTGVSSPELASSTVVAPDAATADGLATVTMVLGAREGRALVEERPDCEACFIAKDRTVTMTSGFRAS